jgi:GAF domain-containing protein
MTVATRRIEPLPADTEARLRDFTALVATAISNAESRDSLSRLADEQSALRRVATLVAAGTQPSELFPAISEEVARAIGLPRIEMVRYEADGSAVVVGASADHPFAVGSVWTLDGPSIMESVRRTGAPARIEDFSLLPGAVAGVARDAGIMCAIGAPIVVGGSTWGAIIAVAAAGDAIPDGSERRLGQFTELVATAISNAQALDDVRELADEQAALRRVATLVARAAAPGEIFAAVAEEVSGLLGLARIEVARFDSDGEGVVIAALGDHPFTVGSRWPLEGPSIMASVFQTGRVARIDDYVGLPGRIAEIARDAGFVSAIGAPIRVGGRTWGAIIAISTPPGPIPDGAERKLGLFTELVATAVSNLQAHDDLHGLADEQAALRRVATLVAEGVAPDRLFLAVATEVAAVLGVSGAILDRYDPDGTAITLALAHDPSWEIAPKIAYPSRRWPLDAGGLTALVYETRQPARVDDYSGVEGEAGEAARAAGVGAGCATPIIVNGSLWGMIRVFSRQGADLPHDAEARLQGFTELVAAAISNAQAIDDLEEIASEQAALRRVATLVAEGAGAETLLSGVAAEVAGVLGASGAEVDRYEPDGTAVMLAVWRHPDWDSVDSVLYPGMQWPPDPGSLTATIQDTRGAARIDDYSNVSGLIGERSRAAGIGTAVAAPIMVDGHVWGALRVFSREGELLAVDAETRLQGFTDLVATAISNAQAHDDLRMLADEQTALRRVATLVAEGADSSDVFDAVCEETGQLIGASSVNLSHYTRDGFNVTMAGWSLRDTHVPVGTRHPLTPDTVGGQMVRSRAPVRIESWDDASSDLAKLVRERGIRSSLGTPIVVDGELWGALVAATDSDRPLPHGTEQRLTRFTELIATAVSNATTRSELVASRARIVAAGDEARRRIERNLHDGTQQRLLAIGLDVQRIRAAVPTDQGDVRTGLERVEQNLESVVEDVRELSRGLHPPMLSRRGLRPTLLALARRSSVPVELEIELDERPSAPIETAVYYAVSESITNAIRHSNASAISVTVVADHQGGPFAIGLDGRRGGVDLHVTIADDGDGGAEPAEGSGLAGLVDRVDALGGRFSLDSPPGGGTRISIVLPLTTRAAP